MPVTITADSPELANAAINSVLLPPQHPNNQEYFKREMETLKQTANILERNVIETAQQIQQHFWNPQIEAMYNSMVRYMTPIVQDDFVYAIYNMEELYHPAPATMRYIMAHPDLREGWYNGNIKGYEEYTDEWYRCIEETHYDYRRATDGMIRLGEDKWTITTYTEGIDNDERPLTFFEKSNIQVTWNTISKFLSEDVDPTDEVF